MRKTKVIKIILLTAIVMVMCGSCKKTCRCYRYDGNVDEFERDYLDERNTSCTYMEQTNFGLTYSLCEYVFF